MATWIPPSDQPVGGNEPLGRRLFDEPMLAGAPMEKHFGGLDLRHFENNDLEFSLDRLGKSGIDGKVVRYLQPRGDAGGKKFKKPRKFHGWAILRAKQLISPPTGKGFQVTPSPITGTGLDENVYHAHAILPATVDPDVNALRLRHIFVKFGEVRPTDAAPTESENRGGAWRLGEVWEFVKRWLTSR